MLDAPPIRWLLPLLLLASVGLGGCDLLGDDDGPLERLEGVWRLQDAEDVWFLAIQDDGDYTSYDYRGDAFDEGPDCFVITRGRIEHVEDDRFRIVDDGETADVDIDIDDDRFTIRVAGGGFSDSSTWVDSDRSTSEFTPECAADVFGTSSRPAKTSL